MDVPAPAELSFDEPSWLYEGPTDARLPLEDAAHFLLELNAEDLGVFVLAYGLGMRFGAVSRTLRLDPALVAWRLRRALERWHRDHATQGAAPRELENALLELLRDPPDAGLPEPPAGRPSWRVADLLGLLEQEVRERLAAQLEVQRPAEPVRPGVGVGLAAVVLLAAVAFMVFGAIRDDHPMRLGRRLLIEGRIAQARTAFLRLGASPQGKKYRALCDIAEGRFEQAFELFEDLEVLASLGQFAPRERPLLSVADAGAGAALLPRGKIVTARPEFVLAAPSTDEILVSLSEVSRSFPAAAGNGKARSYVPFPSDWGDLPSDTLRWSLVGDPGSWARFEVIDADKREELQLHLRRRLPRELKGTAAADFLRAQLFLNQGLLVDAGRELARLVVSFPEAEYPAHRLDDVAAALGVDASAFLR